MQNIKDAQVELINKFKNYLVNLIEIFLSLKKFTILPTAYSECIGSYILRKNIMKNFY